MMNNDLISREALKKVFSDWHNWHTVIGYGKVVFLDKLLEEIDNAPTVEPTFGVFKAICCEECNKNLTTEIPSIEVNIPEDIREDIKNKVIEEMSKPRKVILDEPEPAQVFKRPQGEWIDRIADKGYVECPFCHKQITGGDLNFCVKCGADMRVKDELNRVKDELGGRE